jgi:hypothetical protein
MTLAGTSVDEPVGTTGALDYAPLWTWVKRREAIRIRKEAGEPPPWTDDPILAAYRFCCVRREDDRGTTWVREHVREPYADHPMLWLMLCLCRIINWPDTLEELIDEGAWPSHPEFDPARVTDVLNARKRRGDKVYTGAYMIPAPQDKGADKQAYVAETMVGGLWRRDMADSGVWSEFAKRCRWSLQDAHRWIMGTPGWGPFLAYQAVVDMSYTEILDHGIDLRTWAAAGPGTRRGLNRLHGRATDAALSQERALDEMRAIYEVAELETGVAMDFSDVPNILCETDKYLRVQRGEGKPRALYVHGRGA